jgi:hypothetical protein
MLGGEAKRRVKRPKERLRGQREQGATLSPKVFQGKLLSKNQSICHQKITKKLTLEAQEAKIGSIGDKLRQKLK